MLKQRILTAAILIPLVVLLILFLPPIIFTPLSFVFFLFSFLEWPRLVGYGNDPNQKPLTPREILKGMGLAAILFLGFVLFSWPAYVILIWCLPVLAVFLFPKGIRYYTRGPVGLSIGISILLLTWISLAWLQLQDPKFALYPLVLVWIADSSAYFVGKSFGKHKLAPNISPGKTWEGALGAVVCGILLSSAAYFIFDLGTSSSNIATTDLSSKKLFSTSGMSYLTWIILNTVVVLFSVVGDLFESIFKRVQGVKDSGHLLPGHGGLIDRIDAMLAALPLFAALTKLFN